LSPQQGFLNGLFVGIFFDVTGPTLRLKDVGGFKCRVYLAAAFFCAAQRRLAGAAMRARPSGERTRFFFRGEAIGELGATFGGRPAFRGATVTADPAVARRARACLSVAISASMEERMSVSAMQE